MIVDSPSATIQQPMKDSSTITTSVQVPDGGTLILGGQKMFGESEKESGVPGLSKIPLLSRLFSNRTLVKDESILLILLKPTILLQDEQEERAFGTVISEN